MRSTTALLLIAGTLALAGCGGGGSKQESAATASGAATTAPRTATESAGAAASTTTRTATAPAAKPATITITIEGGRPIGGIHRATVRKGRAVTLVVRSDVADEIHLHGYDLSKEVAAGGSARLRFKARLAGVFEVELEGRGLQIAELTVR